MHDAQAQKRVEANAKRQETRAKNAAKKKQEQERALKRARVEEEDDEQGGEGEDAMME
jgi:hypothetical protein